MKKNEKKQENDRKKHMRDEAIVFLLIRYMYICITKTFKAM